MTVMRLAESHRATIRVSCRRSMIEISARRRRRRRCIAIRMMLTRRNTMDSFTVGSGTMQMARITTVTSTRPCVSRRYQWCIGCSRCGSSRSLHRQRTTIRDRAYEDKEKATTVRERERKVRECQTESMSSEKHRRDVQRMWREEEKHRWTVSLPLDVIRMCQ